MVAGGQVYLKWGAFRRRSKRRRQAMGEAMNILAWMVSGYILGVLTMCIFQSGRCTDD